MCFSTRSPKHPIPQEQKQKPRSVFRLEQHFHSLKLIWLYKMYKCRKEI